MNIRLANTSDTNRIFEIYEYARAYMKAHGNSNQWGDNRPEKSLTKDDIKNQRCYVMEDEGNIFACFVFTIGFEKEYEAKFPSKVEYGVIHRVASDGSKSGIVERIVDFAKGKVNLLRIDTHEDNKTMQKAIERQNFKKLGIIYLEDKSARILYELKEGL
nr:GNAT family protein [uncultured Lachnoanaerobaculum sp.]